MAATESIMLTNTGNYAGTVYSRFLPASLLIIIAVLLFAMSVPREGAAVLRIQGTSVLDALRSNDTLSIDDLNAFIDGRKSVLGLMESGDDWSQLALGQIRLAQLTGLQTTEGLAVLAQAKKSLDQGLRLNPMAPYAWARMAFIQFLQEEQGDKIGNVLAMSWKTGPNEPSLRLSRIDLGFRVWDQLGNDAMRLLERQIYLAWSDHKIRKEFVKTSIKRKKIFFVSKVLGTHGIDNSEIESQINDLKNH